MLFNETKLKRAYIIEFDKKEDKRGYFSRIFCKNEFKENNLNENLCQANISFNHRKGTLRGLHYQIEPFAEAKLIMCIWGEVYDVIVDLRPESPTYGKWTSVNLSKKDNKLLYVPEGIAHGYLTLEDRTGVLYHSSQFYSPKHERGIRYNDPAFDIEWPIEVEVSSDKDRNWPDFVL
jgi:dTDP-4-dehydrorhamnose 3,5-epimerase